MSEANVAIVEDAIVVGCNPRRSVLSRVCQDRDGMLRFVRDPQGRVVFDVDARLPGRGFWLEADRVSVDLAIKRKALLRAAGAGSSIGADLAAQVERTLVQRGLDRIGLARRAGVLIGGFDEVLRVVRDGKAKLLIQAVDAADDGLMKIGRAAGAVPRVRLFDRNELGRALGRDEAVHLALTHEKHAQALLAITGRLAGFRPARPDQPMNTSTERQERLAS